MRNGKYVGANHEQWERWEIGNMQRFAYFPFSFFHFHDALPRTSHFSFSQFIISSSRSPCSFPHFLFSYYSIFEIRIDIKRNQSYTIERLDFYGSAAESATWQDEGTTRSWLPFASRCTHRRSSTSF